MSSCAFCGRKLCSVEEMVYEQCSECTCVYCGHEYCRDYCVRFKKEECRRNSIYEYDYLISDIKRTIRMHMEIQYHMTDNISIADNASLVAYYECVLKFVRNERSKLKRKMGRTKNESNHGSR